MLDELTAVEVAQLAAPKGMHDRDRSQVRHGTENGSVTLAGREVAVSRPRVRAADNAAEASLQVYDTARPSDPLGGHMVGAMLAGLTARVLDERFVIVFIGGFSFGERQLVAALRRQLAPSG